MKKLQAKFAAVREPLARHRAATDAKRAELTRLEIALLDDANTPRLNECARLRAELAATPAQTRHLENAERAALVSLLNSERRRVGQAIESHRPVLRAAMGERSRLWSELDKARRHRLPVDELTAQFNEVTAACVAAKATMDAVSLEQSVLIQEGRFVGDFRGVHTWAS